MARVIDRKDIPLESLELDPANVRSGAVNIESGELEASIEEHGVLEDLDLQGGEEFSVDVDVPILRIVFERE